MTLRRRRDDARLMPGPGPASWRKPLRDRFENLLGVGPFTAVELGVDHLVVEGDLVGRPPPALQLDADVAREPVGDRLPETSGLGEVVSNRAVLDRDHADSVVWRGDGLASPGVAARSPGARNNLTRLRRLRRFSRGPDSPLSCSGFLIPVRRLGPFRHRTGRLKSRLVESVKSGLPIHARTGGANGAEAGPRSER